MNYDFIIIGSGLTGSTCARLLTDAGKKVLVLERRNHIAGNIYDEIDEETGIRYNIHGPHYFRTNSGRIWNFVKRFADWRLWAAEVRSHVDSRDEHWPVTSDYISNHCGLNWRDSLYKNLSPMNFEEMCLTKMPCEIYHNFVKYYTEKQWGVSATSLQPQLAARFQVRTGSDRRFTQHMFQALPQNGYTKFIESMLTGIDLKLNFHDNPHSGRWTETETIPIIHTGSIDEFFNYGLGRLKYRAQGRMIKRDRNTPGQQLLQPVPQINDPSAGSIVIRAIEWKHMMEIGEREKTRGSLYTYEIPRDAVTSDDREYPFPDDTNAALYAKYRDFAAREFPNVIFAGRLGRYQYLDMDQAIGSAMVLVQRLLGAK